MIGYGMGGERVVKHEDAGWSGLVQGIALPNRQADCYMNRNMNRLEHHYNINRTVPPQTKRLFSRLDRTSRIQASLGKFRGEKFLEKFR
jgi:hypothetical protein